MLESKQARRQRRQPIGGQRQRFQRFKSLEHSARRVPGVSTAAGPLLGARCPKWSARGSAESTATLRYDTGTARQTSHKSRFDTSGPLIGSGLAPVYQISMSACMSRRCNSSCGGARTVTCFGTLTAAAIDVNTFALLLLIISD